MRVEDHPDQRVFMAHAANLYPELLAALKAIYDHAYQAVPPCTGDDDPGCVFCVARDAIAKAEGREVSA